MMKRILVGLGGTPYTPSAIEQAVNLAQRHDAEVTGVTVLDVRRVSCEGIGTTKSLNRSVIQSERLQIVQTRLEESLGFFETACQAAHVKYRLATETGEPFTRLVDLARYHDLMIFGLRSVFEYDFLAGDPESLLIRLVDAGVRPVIAVSERTRSIGRVLIAFSGSMESAKAMKRFVQMRLWPSADLKIVTFHPSEATSQTLLQAAQEYCHAHGYRTCCQSNPGDPSALLLAAAALWQADMIVMGNSARHVFLRKVLGDTLVQTLRETTLPLFLAH